MYSFLHFTDIPQSLWCAKPWAKHWGPWYTRQTQPAFMLTSHRNLEVWACNCLQKHKPRMWHWKVSPLSSPCGKWKSISHLTWEILGLSELTNESSLKTRLRMYYCLQRQTTGTKEVITQQNFFQKKVIFDKGHWVTVHNVFNCGLWKKQKHPSTEDSLPGLRRAENCVRADSTDSECYTFWWTKWHSSLANLKEQRANVSTRLFFTSPTP